MVGSVSKSSKMLYDFELYMCIFVMMLKYTTIPTQFAVCKSDHF
jgi:hypothetical protein